MNPQYCEFLHLCIHESAHAHVARHLGFSAHWRVHPVPSSDPYEWSSWIGHTRYYGEPSLEHERIIALAGCVGETLWGDPACDASSVEEFIWVNGLSETDATYSSGYSYEDIEQTLEIVRSLRSKIQADALAYLVGRLDVHVSREHLAWGQIDCVE